METLLKELEDHLKKLVDNFKEELQGIRSGRPSTQLLENIQVDYFDQKLPLRQLAALSVKPPREIDVAVWDRSVIQAATKAIESANIGLSPNVEGSVIRCFLPPLTEERRQELMKLVKKMAEETRIKIRTQRDDTNKKVKIAETEKQIDEDAAFRAKEKIQKLVDSANSKVEEFVAGKIKELQE